MSDKTVVATSPSIPLRAPQRWFKCIEYGPGLKIELPFSDEQEAIASGIAHLRACISGTVKIGYYGFRSRVIVYTAYELKVLSAL